MVVGNFDITGQRVNAGMGKQSEQTTGRRGRNQFHQVKLTRAQGMRCIEGGEVASLKSSAATFRSFLKHLLLDPKMLRYTAYSRWGNSEVL